MKNIQPLGNCPYCDSLQGVNNGWFGSPEMIERLKDKHEKEHIKACLTCGRDF